ncbi:hypothetical protein N9P56_00050 [Flavobacteriaceae bacterium]|nr:hypothetical protein [Flavobacteriaceae bacterium]
MKNIKDITISIFAIIGFAFLLSSFTTNETEETTQQVYGTPESHVWDMIIQNGSGNTQRLWTLNKVTGEVRKHNLAFDNKKPDEVSGYIIMKPLN